MTWVRRLQRRATRAGLVDVGHGRAVADRHLAMTPDLPLAERMARYIPRELGVELPMPIVYAQPRAPGHPGGDPSPDVLARPARPTDRVPPPVVPATRVPATGVGDTVIQRKVDPSAAPPSLGAIAELPDAGATTAVPEPAEASPAPGPAAWSRPPVSPPDPLPLAEPLRPLAGEVVTPADHVIARGSVVPMDTAVPAVLSEPLGTRPTAGAGAPAPLERRREPGRDGERPVVSLAAARPPVPSAGGAATELPVVVPEGMAGAPSDRGGLPVLPGRPVVHARSGREADGHGRDALPVVPELPVAPSASAPALPLALVPPPAARPAAVPASHVVEPANGHRIDRAVVVPASVPARPTILRPEPREQPEQQQRDEPEPRVDVDRIADQVHKRFLRQLAVEAERRGAWGVRR